MKKPWIIYGEDGGAVVKLRESSTRQGRAMRHAQEIARYTQGRVFISTEDSTHPQQSGRWYTTEAITEAQQQLRNRQRAKMSAQESLDEVLVDAYYRVTGAKASA